MTNHDQCGPQSLYEPVTNSYDWVFVVFLWSWSSLLAIFFYGRLVQYVVCSIKDKKNQTGLDFKALSLAFVRSLFLFIFVLLLSFENLSSSTAPPMCGKGLTWD